MSEVSPIPSVNVSGNVSAQTLHGYLSQSVEEFCGKYGKKKDDINHCAHFVSHVLSLRIPGAALCSNVGGSEYTYKERNEGFCVRVNQVFNNSRNRTYFDEKKPPTSNCFVVATIKGNIISEDPLFIGDHRTKHIGIYAGGSIYHYSNTRDAVVAASVSEFKTHYGTKTILLRADLP